MNVTLRNDFHATECVIRCDVLIHQLSCARELSDDVHKALLEWVPVTRRLSDALIGQAIRQKASPTTSFDEGQNS